MSKIKMKKEKVHFAPINQPKKKKYTGLSAIPPYATEEERAQVQATGQPLQAKKKEQPHTIEPEKGGYILTSNSSGEPIDMIHVENAKEMAMLALHVYGPDEKGEHKEEVPAGWRTLLPNEFDELGVTADDFVNEMTGFKSQLYINEEKGTYVYVFAGTDYGTEGDERYVATIKDKLSEKDQKNNVRQGAGLQSDQYDQAFRTTKKLVTKIGKDKLQLAGHSLGGGLASFVGTVLRLKTITFNASGVNKWGYLKQEYGLDVEEAPRYVTAFYRVGDILHAYQEDFNTKGLLPDAIGNQIAITVAGDKTLTGLPEKRRVEGIKRHENLKDMYEALGIFKKKEKK